MPSLGLGIGIVKSTGGAGVLPAPVNGLVYDVFNLVYDGFYLIYQ